MCCRCAAGGTPCGVSVMRSARRSAHVMVGEVAGGAPGTGAGDEGLHQRALGLHGVVEVVGSPLIDHVAECDGAKLRVAGALGEVGGGKLGQESEGLLPQGGELTRHPGRTTQVHWRLRIWIEAGEVLAGEEGAHTGREDRALDIEQVAQALGGGPLAVGWRTHEQVSGHRLRQREPASGRSGEDGAGTWEQDVGLHGCLLLMAA